MNKKCFLLLHMLGIALIAGACGAVEDTTETATEYVSKGYSVETGASGTQQTETEEAFSFSNKAIGNLTEKSVKLIKNTVVYVAPDRNSAQLGSLEKGTKVKTVGKTEKDEWLMVNYNGRVAYIKSNSIDGDELSSVEEGGDSRGHGSTTNESNSDTNSGGTGNTVKKPSNTNSGSTGNTVGTGSGSGNTGNGTIASSEPSNGSDDSDSGGNTSETEKPSQPSTEPVTPITPSEPDTTEPDNSVTPPTESDNSPESEESLDGE